MMTPHRIPEPAEHIYDTHVRLRGIGPVVPVELPGGVAVWAATTHDAVNEILADDKVYARNVRHWPALRDGTVPADWPFLPYLVGDNMLMQDGADHRRMRTMVNRAFTPARVAALAPRVTEIAASLVDDVAEAGDGVDLVATFGGVLPTQVICELFGVPEADRARFRLWTQQVMSASEDGVRAHAAMVDYLTRFVDRRRGEPEDDLTSMLIKVQEDGDVALSDAELADLLWLILLAGNETTAHLLANAVVALSRHPDQRDLAVRDGLWSQVVEETLRRYPSVATVLMRYTTRETTLAGVDLPAGAAILLSLSATLTDPAQHGADAERFDITRAQRSNLAFGHGPHFCLGAPLGKLEGRIGLAALYERFPKLRMAIDPAELVYPSFSTTGPAALPVLL
jgi:2-hydroxy-5-methyl-1-naphthoate 7-hydroxylase